MPSQEALLAPPTLIWARETAGYSLDEAAKKVGVRPRRLIEWEEGVRSPSMPQARQLARVYRRPLAILFRREPPRDPALPPDFRVGDADGRTTTPELRHELRIAAFRRSVALELDPAPQQQVVDLIGTIPTTANPEEAGERVRDVLAVAWDQQIRWRDNYKALNAWRGAVESLGVLVFRFSGVPVGVARGFSIGGGPYPVVALNATDAPAGRVFTLIHEVGHILAGTGGVCDLDDRTARTSPDAVAIERFCNRLAAAVLMPADRLIALPAVADANPETRWSLASLNELANTLSVSRQALLIRLLEVEKTNERAYQRTTDELNAAMTVAGGGFELVPEGAIRELGAPYARLVLSAYHDEQISARDLAEYLGVRFKWVDRIEHLLDTAQS